MQTEPCIIYLFMMWGFIFSTNPVIFIDTYFKIGSDNMDIQEATHIMAKMMVEEEIFYNEHLKDVDPTTIEDKETYNKKLKEFEILEAYTREFGNELAATPNFFEVLESWKVIVKGYSGVSKEAMQEAYNKSDVEDLVDRTGSMAQGIKRYFKTKGYFISGMGAGEDGWDIGVICNDKTAKDICSDLYKYYIKAINLGLISISRRFLKQHYLPGLYNWEDARRLLKL